jgi:hypothetical protein
MSNNQFVLGTIKNGRMSAVHINGLPVKYWPDGPGTVSGGPGWYYWDDEDDTADEGFCRYPLEVSPWDYPIVQGWDTEYRSLVLLVIVPDNRILNVDTYEAVKPYTAEQVKAFLGGWER